MEHRVTGGRGVVVDGRGYARLPDGTRALLEEELRTSERPPLYAGQGKLRVVEFGPDRLLLGPDDDGLEESPLTPPDTPTPTPPDSPPVTPPATPTGTPTPSATPTPPGTPTGPPPNTPPAAPPEPQWTPDWI